MNAIKYVDFHTQAMKLMLQPAESLSMHGSKTVPRDGITIETV
jgi:hypothetical protein